MKTPADCQAFFEGLNQVADHFGYHTEIVDYVGLHYSTISRWIRQMEKEVT